MKFTDNLVFLADDKGDLHGILNHLENTAIEINLRCKENTREN